MRNYGHCFNIKVNFPKKCHYLFELFGKSGDDHSPKSKPVLLVRHRIVALKAKGLKAKFPVKAIKEGLDIISPLDYNLNRVIKTFEVLSQNAKEIAIFNKDKIEQFNQEKSGFWRCSTPLLKGDAVIKIRNEDGNWLEGFKFLVK